jgi:rhamnosyltransferase
MSRRVVAVVTAYKPTPALVHNVMAIQRQVDEIVVVDDGSGPGYDDVLDAVRAEGGSVVRSPFNSGIAAALNAGMREVDAAPGDLVVTFDQDSQVPERFVSALVRRWDEAREAGIRIGLVAPQLFAGIDQSSPEAGPGVADRPIQSGMLLSGEVYTEAGQYREDFFIDLVDVEYFLRVRALGYATLAVPGLELPHELGVPQSASILGRPMRASLSAPFRYYFRVRNRRVIDDEYRLTERWFLRRERRAERMHLVVAMLFARPVWKFVILALIGHRDGRKHLTGPLPARAAEIARGITWRGSARAASGEVR